MIFFVCVMKEIQPYTCGVTKQGKTVNWDQTVWYRDRNKAIYEDVNTWTSSSELLWESLQELIWGKTLNADTESKTDDTAGNCLSNVTVLGRPGETQGPGPI